MTWDIQLKLNSFLQRGEYLQNQLSAIKTPKTVMDDARRDLVGEAAHIFIKDVLELPFGGKARKYSKALMRQQEQKRIEDAERIIERDYLLWTQNIEDYLLSVSLVKSDLTPSGNSHARDGAKLWRKPI